jgi:hypothetical protein
LAGAKSVKEVTVELGLKGFNFFSNAELTRILCPLIYLRKEVVVTFKGIPMSRLASTQALNCDELPTVEYMKEFAMWDSYTYR